MAAPNELNLQITGDATNYNRAADSANKSTARLGQTAQQVGRGASQSFEQMAVSASRSQRGVSDLTSSLAKGVLAGTLLAGSFAGALSALRDYTSEAAKLAARNETLAVVSSQLAKANGLNDTAVQALVVRMKELGITTQQSFDAVNKMIAAQLDLSKATDLARLAQDAAVVAGVNSSQALEGIVNGITTQQIEVLRTYGINVQFERVFQQARQRLGRDLTDLERKNLALNTVLKQAPTIAGSYEASLGTVGKQMSSLARFSEEAAAAVGQKFLPELKAIVTAATDAAKWVKENADGVATFVKVLGASATAAAFVTLIGYVKGLATALIALNATAAANPYAFLVVTTVAAGAAFAAAQQKAGAFEAQTKKTSGEVAGQAKEIQNTAQALKEYQVAALLAANAQGNLPLTKEAIEAMKASADNIDFSEAIKRANAKQIEEIQKQEAEKLAKEIGKKQVESTRATLEAALQAEAELIKGPGRALLDIQRKAQQERSFVDEKGVLREFQLNLGTRENLEREFRAKVLGFAKEAVAEEAKLNQDLSRANIENYERELERRRSAIEQIVALENETAQAQLDYQQKVAEQSRDRQLAALEGVNALTVEQKIEVEQRKVAIEQEFQQQSQQLKKDQLELDRQLELISLEGMLASKLVKVDEYERLRLAIEQRYLQRREQVDLDVQAAIDAAKQAGQIRTQQIVVDSQQRAYDDLKRQIEGSFDALVASGRSASERLKAAFLLPLLAMIKQIAVALTTQVLAPLVGIQQQTVSANQKGSGIFGQLLGLGGAGLFGAGGQLPGPGGTGGFAGPVNLGGGTSSIFGGGAGAAGGFGGLKATGTNALGFLKSLGGLGGGNSRLDVNGNVVGGKGVGGAGGGALLLGGGILAADGLRRGGFTGLAETTAGGALIGFKFGGPVGAAIGAGVGAVAGTIRLFIKGAEEKIVEKVRNAYGITIQRSFARDPLLAIIKQNFGGNVDVGIRSQQVKDLIELYAMSTGQPIGGLGAKFTPVSLVQTSSGLFQAPQFFGGSLLPSGGGTIPDLPVVTAAPSQSQTTVINIPGAQEFFRNETLTVVSENGRIVQTSAQAAAKRGVGTLEAVRLATAPNLVLG